MNRDTRIAYLEARRAMTSDSANWMAYVDKLVDCLSARDAAFRERLEVELTKITHPATVPGCTNSDELITDDLSKALARGAVGHAGRHGSGNYEDDETDYELSSLDVAADHTF